MTQSLLLPLLATLAAAAAAAGKTCNQGSPLACDCASCWDDLPLAGAIDWIAIETDACDATVNERTLRTKLALWSTEECGSSVHCGLALPIKPEQVLLGRVACNATSAAGAIALALLRTAPASGAEPITQAGLLPPSLVGAILHAREPLVAIVLRAHLRSVQITRRRAAPAAVPVPSTTVPVPVPGTTRAPPAPVPVAPAGVVLAAGCFGAALLVLVVYAFWGRIEWKQWLAGGRWKRRVYRKVPDVLFRSADEQPPLTPSTVPQSHSAQSFTSTTQLIRY